MTIEVEQNMDIAMEIETEIDIPEIEVEELPEISLEIEEMSNVEESNGGRNTDLFSRQEESISNETNEMDTVTEAQQTDGQDGGFQEIGSKRERVVASAKQKIA